MNELMLIIEEILTQYSHAALVKLHQSLATPDTQIGTLLHLPLNIEYAFKRFIGACLAKQPEMKFNSYTALATLSSIEVTLDIPILVTYALELSNHHKHCGGAKMEMESYAIGKILIIKALARHLVDNEGVVVSLASLFEEYPQFQEQILDILSEVAKNKSNKKTFIELEPTLAGAATLHKLLRAKVTKKTAVVTPSEIKSVLQEATALYPKKSIALLHIGSNLHLLLEDPGKLFDELINSLEDQNQNMRALYYIMWLMESHIHHVKLSRENASKMLSVGMVKCWLAQLRVKNKKMRALAQHIRLCLHEDAPHALEMIQELHASKVYLQNISLKHPLHRLYLVADAGTLWAYLLDLAAKKEEDIEEDELTIEYLSELEFVARERINELTSEQVGKTLTLLIAKYHENKSEDRLNLIWNLLNLIIIPLKSRKVWDLKQGGSILRRIKIEEIGVSDKEMKDLRKVVMGLRLMTKQPCEESQLLKNAFLSFVLAICFYALIYPEEAEVCQEIKAMQEDLSALLFENGDEGKPKKKRKTEEDPKKAIHVLVDMFIGLLTKAPQFLRCTIERFFELLIPELETTDLKQLLEVIQRPDQEYIEEI